MKFSVLLSIYSKEQPDNLRQCLNSIMLQTRQPDEIILVEDGPLTDALYTVVNEYKPLLPQMKAIPQPINRGLGHALSVGLDHCSHDIIARMDTDDIAKDNRFERQIKVFEQNPDIDVVGSWIEEFRDNVSNIISIRNVPEQHEDIMAFAKKRNPVNHPAVAFRKQAVKDAGGYQYFYLFEDYMLWVRMLQHGCRFYNIQESLLWFRTSENLYKRRGGLKYAVSEIRFFNYLVKIGFISHSRFFLNIFMRFTVRIIPNFMRSLFYQSALRLQGRL